MKRNPTPPVLFLSRPRHHSRSRLYTCPRSYGFSAAAAAAIAATTGFTRVKICLPTFSSPCSPADNWSIVRRSGKQSFPRRTEAGGVWRGVEPRQKHAPILFHNFFSWGGKGEFFTGVHRANLLSVKGNMQLVSFRKEKTFLENKLADALKWKELLVGFLFLRGRLVSPPSK